MFDTWFPLQSQFYVINQGVKFTATNYCDFDNLGVIMKVDKDMVTSFLQIQPDNLIRKAALSGKGPETAI